MTFLKPEKFLFCIPLRIGVMLSAHLFLLWKLKLLFHDITSFYNVLYSIYFDKNEDRIPMTDESKLSAAYGVVHLIVVIIDIILAILLILGMFNKTEPKYVQSFYKGVIGTVFIDVVSFAFIAGVYASQLLKLNPEDRFLPILIYLICEFFITTAFVIYFIIAARSYYFYSKKEIVLRKDKMMTF